MRRTIIWWKTTLVGIVFVVFGLAFALTSLYGDATIFVGLSTNAGRIIGFVVACFGIGFGVFLTIVSVDRFEIVCPD